MKKPPTKVTGNISVSQARRRTLPVRRPSPDIERRSQRRTRSPSPLPILESRRRPYSTMSEAPVQRRSQRGVASNTQPNLANVQEPSNRRRPYSAMSEAPVQRRSQRGVESNTQPILANVPEPPNRRRRIVTANLSPSPSSSPLPSYLQSPSSPSSLPSYLQSPSSPSSLPSYLPSPPPTPPRYPISNPNNDPETARIIQRLTAIQEQDKELEKLCGKTEAAAGGERCDVTWNENRKRIEDLAREIESQWAKIATLDDNRAIAEANPLISGYEESIVIERAHRQQMANLREHGVRTLNQIMSSLSRGGADIIVSMILLAALTTTETHNNLITSIFGTGHLASLYHFLSTHIVRPFVEHNINNILALPEYIVAINSANAYQQMHAFVGLFITGVNAYGVNALVRGSSMTRVANVAPNVTSSIIRNITDIGAFIGGSGTNLVNSLIENIHENLLYRPELQPGEDDDTIVTNSTYSSNASSAQIGSVLETIFRDEDSIDPVIRGAFQSLVPDSQGVDSQISMLTESQMSFDESQTNGGKPKSRRRKAKSNAKTVRRKRANLDRDIYSRDGLKILP